MDGTKEEDGSIEIPEPDYSSEEESGKEVRAAIHYANSKSDGPPPDLENEKLEVGCQDEEVPSLCPPVASGSDDNLDVPEPDYSDEENAIEVANNTVADLKLTDESDCSHVVDAGVIHVEGHSVETGSLSPRESVANDDGSLIVPKKLVNPCKESRQHAALRKELMLNNKLGKNTLEKPELTKVLNERKEKTKKKEHEEYLQKKRTSLDIRLEEQAKKVNQTTAEKQQQPDCENIKTKQQQESEFQKIHSKISKTKSES